MTITIIIPTLNEEDNIGKLLTFLSLHQNTNVEIVVVDGGSEDKTVEVSESYKNVRTLKTNLMSRAKQMNLGAKEANGEILYFVHADVMPLESFIEDIRNSLRDDRTFGCYRFKFDKKNASLQFNAFFTRFKFMFCRGGDQTLFIPKALFNKHNGFNEDYCIMEDFEFIKRLKKKEKFIIVDKSVVVSARKYKHNSYLKVNMINLLSYWMFMLGVSPEFIRQFYKKNLVMKYE